MMLGASAGEGLSPLELERVIADLEQVIADLEACEDVLASAATVGGRLTDHACRLTAPALLRIASDIRSLVDG